MVTENGMVMLTAKEYDELVREAEDTKLLRSAIVKMLKEFKEKTTEDVELSCGEFLATYNAALADMWEQIESGEDKNEIYGNDVTVHWHGLYCNCQDGATVTNTVIDGLEACADELDE